MTTRMPRCADSCSCFVVDADHARNPFRRGLVSHAGMGKIWTLSALPFETYP